MLSKDSSARKADLSRALHSEVNSLDSSGSHCSLKLKEVGMTSETERIGRAKLGRIIQLRKIIWKYSVFVLLFGTQIGSKQASL